MYPPHSQKLFLNFLMICMQMGMFQVNYHKNICWKMLLNGHQHFCNATLVTILTNQWHQTDPLYYQGQRSFRYI
ncbi:hypothetical protein SE19_03560 [Acidiplasma aeolicum]|uniref:Uncharacterized protein n=1 Tax=Acidiplasma aeolicum TaxID=507754 RepID=A0A0Q0RIW2_9ARCH|nr:hypothetical protein SE19_03560 [Acidiplasma aeolicum]KQB35374.1 hypothetical protein AOG54_03120 [Acidiplasma aeolicum]